MRARCPSTVRSERNKAAATSLFVFPSATRAQTRSSAGVNAPGVAARPLIRLSSARARSAHRAASMLLEDGKRRLERRPCLASALHAPLCSAEHKERAAAVEWKLYLRVPLERLVVRCERVIEFACLGGEQAAAARAVRERRHPLETPRVALVPVEQLDGLLSPSELDQRLDLIDDESNRAGLDEPLRPHELDSWCELSHGLERPSRRELDVTESCSGQEVGDSSRALVEDGLRRSSCVVDTPSLRLHEPFEGEVQPVEERLAGLLGGLLTVVREIESKLEVSEELLDLPEEVEEPGLSILVTELLRALCQLRETATRPLVHVDVRPVLGK